VLLVELEIAYGERPFSFPNTYQAVRGSVEELNQAATLRELYDATARAVRDLTGFDRVMGCPCARYPITLKGNRSKTVNDLAVTAVGAAASCATFSGSTLV
jgi:hypothetical protein